MFIAGLRHGGRSRHQSASCDKRAGRVSAGRTQTFLQTPSFAVTTVIAISLQRDRRQTSVFNMTSYPTNSQKDTRTQFEQIVLLLQGGGALGSYQAGVYQALAEADLHPNWVAGISIGAINAAIIAGNAPDKRVERLREFWEAVSASPLGIPYFKSIELQNAFVHQLVNQGRAVSILLFGDPNFFTPRVPLSMLWPAGTPDKASYYDTTPLKATLGRLVDFDRINAGSMRFSVGAVN